MVNFDKSISDEVNSEIVLAILKGLEGKSISERIALKEILVKVHDVLEELTNREPGAVAMGSYGQPS